jgi:Fic family protein
MAGDFELRTKHQFARLVERRERLRVLKESAALQARFAQLLGPIWARDSYALDEMTKSLGSFQQTGNGSKARQLRCHADAAQWLYQTSQTQASLSSGDLVELHRRLLSAMDTSAGHFRESEVSSLAEGHEPLEAELVPFAVQNALEWFNAASFHEMHEVEKTALVLMKLADIVPFEQGNGLTLRLFANFFLLRGGYVPAVIGPRCADRYSAAIKDSFRFHTQPLIDLLAEAVLEGLQYCLAEPAAPPQLRVLS